MTSLVLTSKFLLLKQFISFISLYCIFEIICFFVHLLYGEERDVVAIGNR